MSSQHQKIVVHGSQLGFEQLVNEWLAKGWTVVPGTTYFGSVKATPNKNTRPEHVEPSGSTNRIVYSVVLLSPKEASAATGSAGHDRAN
jgi:hypothetical protein